MSTTRGEIQKLKFTGAVDADGHIRLINHLPVERAVISPPFKWAPSRGAELVTGRWHLYRVVCAEEDITLFQQHIRPGWYAHFWKDERLTIIYSDARFDAALNDRSTWTDAVAHGRTHDIPERELDFKDI
ncbi:hypothetical protein [Candidatus Binatus soli]|jgi:hypothetical protein|uniref:hypothetical protein n=1 Tax=Candidatus Binatus soli TaxID=1953413 RepID=UPI003D12EFBF